MFQQYAKEKLKIEEMPTFGRETAAYSQLNQYGGANEIAIYDVPGTGYLTAQSNTPQQQSHQNMGSSFDNPSAIQNDDHYARSQYQR